MRSGTPASEAARWLSPIHPDVRFDAVAFSHRSTSQASPRCEHYAQRREHSIVIHPDRSDQIHCGKTPIKTIKNVVYASPNLPNGKSKPLKMDILIPEPARKRTIVVYVPGGGFVVAAKEGALNLRTYVAEAGFAVASVEYRTTRDGANYRDGVEDVKAAIRYLRANAGKYGIDASTCRRMG